VTYAFIERTAEVVRALPELKDAAVIQPDPELPRLRCFLFFKDEDPTKSHSHHIRAQTWSMANLRELRDHIDKEYSRVASNLAIPLLLKEINIQGEPKLAEQRFWSMFVGPELSWTPTGKTERDINEEVLAYAAPFQNESSTGDEEKGGSESWDACIM